MITSNFKTTYLDAHLSEHYDIIGACSGIYDDVHDWLSRESSDDLMVKLKNSREYEYVMLRRSNKKHINNISFHKDLKDGYPVLLVKGVEINSILHVINILRYSLSTSYVIDTYESIEDILNESSDKIYCNKIQPFIIDYNYFDGADIIVYLLEFILSKTEEKEYVIEFLFNGSFTYDKLEVKVNQSNEIKLTSIDDHVINGTIGVHSDDMYDLEDTAAFFVKLLNVAFYHNDITNVNVLNKLNKMINYIHPELYRFGLFGGTHEFISFESMDDYLKSRYNVTDEEIPALLKDPPPYKLRRVADTIKNVVKCVTVKSHNNTLFIYEAK